MASSWTGLKGASLFVSDDLTMRRGTRLAGASATFVFLFLAPIFAFLVHQYHMAASALKRWGVPKAVFGVSLCSFKSLSDLNPTYKFRSDVGMRYVLPVEDAAMISAISESIGWW